MTPHFRRIFLVLLIALALRLVYGLSQERLSLYERESGGDSWWYLDYGRSLVVSQEPGPPPSGPLYLIWVGIPQHLFSPEGAIVIIRILQAIISTATCYFAYQMAWAISQNEAVGLLAAGVLAISPVLVIESAQLLTETLYVFLLSAGLWLYVRVIQASDSHSHVYRVMGLVGVLLGLATLTRAVLLAFPLGLAIHLLLVYGWRRGLKRALVLLVVYAMMVSTWTIYNRVKWNQWVVGAQGFASFLYLGSSDTGWQGPTAVDAALAQENGGTLPSDPSQQQQIYQNSAVQQIMSDLPGWLVRRATKLAEAYLQPHGTTFFPGESLKDLAAGWLANDRSISGFVRLTQSEGFWPKLVIYVFHYVGLLAGLVGMWLTRRNWRIILPLIGLILYTSLVHFVLDVLPRYLFPLEVFWWVFAAVALVALGRHIPFLKLPQRRQKTHLDTVYS